jgi:predicted nucleotidyltransferase
MTDSDRRVLEAFAVQVRALFPQARIWAFGSRARGDAAPDSDLDVCVVVEGLDEDADRSILAVAWEVGFANDVIISTLTFSLEEFTTGPLTRSPIVQEIRRNGVAA